MGSQLPEEDGPQLRLERPSEHVAVVVIDAPAVANALNSRFFAELAVALDTIEQDDAIRAWLLTGAPRPDGRPWFSSGADLRGVRATLGFLQLQADMPKNEALRWAQLTPGYMGLELRPFQDSAQRFYRARGEPAADAGGSRETDGPG